LTSFHPKKGPTFLLAREQEMLKVCIYMDFAEDQVEVYMSKQEEQVESPGAQNGLGGTQERLDVAPEPTFPTDIRARTRSDIGLSVDRKAETTSVTADSGKLDEGEPKPPFLRYIR
jgi:hypothetical protein